MNKDSSVLGQITMMDPKLHVRWGGRGGVGAGVEGGGPE